MASDDLDIPQIAVVGVPDDSDPFSSALALPSSSLDGSILPSLLPADSDFYGFLSPPTPNLGSARNSLDFDSPSHASGNSSLPPPSSPTLTARSSGSICWANLTALRDNNPEDHDGLSSGLCLAPPSHGYRRKGSVGTVSSIASSSTERDVEDNLSFRLSPLRSAESARVPTPSPLAPNNGSPGNSEPPIKKKRKRADARQLEALDRMYAHTASPSTEERQQLTSDLDMLPRSGQIWFQNKRQQCRQTGQGPCRTNFADFQTSLGERQYYDLAPLRILKSPDQLNPTLSCWIKNMDKLPSLIDRLQELASSAPPEHRSKLLDQVVGLSATSKKQKEHFMEFLQLSEEYANKYLLDISAEIERQSSFLEKLEERLKAATRLCGEAVDLQMFYESGTVATMKNFRATAVSRPLQEDCALFSEVDMLLTEIRQCYVELNKFWTEEISRASEALRERCVDSTDFERWKNFHGNLKQTIGSWKNELPSHDPQSQHRNYACSSKETDIGAKASSLSSAMGSLTSALDRLLSSNSLKYSQSGGSFMQQVYVKFAANIDMCLSFLRQCVDYGEKVFALCLPSIGSPTSPTYSDVHDLRERTMRLRSKFNSEITSVPMENAASVQGSRKFKAVYSKALRSEQKATSGLDTLLEKLSSWVTVTDGHGFPDDALPDVIALKELREQWVEARDSVSAALATFKDEPVLQLFCRSTPLTSTRALSLMKHWIINFCKLFMIHISD